MPATRHGALERVFRSPLAMVAAALLLRLVVMSFMYTDQLDPARDHFSFGFETGRVARSLALGQGFNSPYPEPTGPTALLAPAYPYLLAGVFRLFGIYSPASALAILTLNNLFSALTCIPVFFIARKVFGQRAAKWAGWTWAVFPYAVDLANKWVWETTLTTLLLSLILLFTLHIERSERLGVWLGYGLLWGLATLCSPVVLSLLPFLMGWAWWRQRRIEEGRSYLAGAAVLVFLVSVTPWLVRNYRTFGQFIFFRNNFALEFNVGNNDDSSKPGSDTILPADNPAEMERVRRLGEMAYMAEKRQQAWAFVRQQPGRFVWLTMRRVLCVWTGIWSLHPSWRLEEEFGVANIVSYVPLTLLALLGLRQAIRKRREYVVLLCIPLLFFPLAYYLTHPDIRYRHPIDPEIVILAVVGAIYKFGKQQEETPACHDPLRAAEKSLVA